MIKLLLKESQFILNLSSQADNSSNSILVRYNIF
jgi:hypothetical protein